MYALFKIKYVTLVFMLGAFLLFSPQQAFAQACADAEAGRPLVQALEKAVSTQIKALDKAVEARKKTVKTAHKVTQERSVLAVNGTTTAKQAATEFEVMSNAKTLDAYGSGLNLMRKRQALQQIARDKAVTAAGCISVAERERKSEAEFLNRAAEKSYNKISVANINNVAGLNAIEKQRDMYLYNRKFACSSDMANAPEGCGEGDGGEKVGAVKKMATLLFSGTTLKPGSQKEIAMFKESINSKSADKMALPAYQTAAGQRSYVAMEAQKVRQILVDYNFDKAFADITATSNTGDAEYDRAIRNLGKNPPAVLIDFYDGKKTDQVSMATIRKNDKNSFMSAQTALDRVGLSQGAASWKTVDDFKKGIRLQYEMLQAKKLENLIAGVRYAQKFK